MSWLSKLFTGGKGYSGDYKGNDADAKADESLWGAIQEGFELIDQGYNIDIGSLNREKDYILGQSELSFDRAQSQFGSQAFQLGNEYRTNQASMPGAYDEMLNQYMNKRTLDNYNIAGKGLSMERDKGIADIGTQMDRLGLEKQRAYLEGVIQFRENQRNVKNNPIAGWKNRMMDNYNPNLDWEDY